MLWIFFTCYFCFYFASTLYTNVLNTVVFVVRKGKKKEILTPNLPSLPPLPTETISF